RAESFRVPRRHFPEHPASVWLAEHFEHPIEMTDHYPHPFLESRLGQQLSCLQVMLCVQKNPWIIESPAANAHPCTPGLLEHHRGRLRGGHIAIANHRNRFNGLRYG